MTKLANFLKDESGASAAEYALILAIVGLGIVTAVTGLKGAIETAIDTTADRINEYVT